MNVGFASLLALAMENTDSAHGHIGALQPRCDELRVHAMNRPSWTDAERALCRELLSRETRFERVAEPWARVQVVGEPLVRNAAAGARHGDGFDSFLALLVPRGEKMLGLEPSRAAPRGGRCAPRRDDSGCRATPYRGRALGGADDRGG